jgi:hypothetical protein
MVQLTYIINVLLGLVLEKLTTMERCQSKTDKISSLLLKTVIARVLNTTVVFYILYRMKPTNPMASEGLAAKVMGLITFSAEIKIFNDLVQPMSKIKKLLSASLFKYNPRERINMFQIQLNRAGQNLEFNLVGQCSYYIVMVYIAAFYSLIVPFANLTLLILMPLHYWIDKYILLKQMTCPVDFGYRLTRLIIRCFEGSLLVFAIGHFYWSQKMGVRSPQLANCINITSIGITATYTLASLFLPLYIKEKLFGKLFMPNIIEHSYTHCLQTSLFKKFYSKENPATCFLPEKGSNKISEHSPQLNLQGGTRSKERCIQVLVR